MRAGPGGIEWGGTGRTWRSLALALPLALALVGVAVSFVAAGEGGESERRGVLYVANLRSSTVTALDVASGEILARWPVAANPHEFALADQTLYVSNYRSDQLTALERGPEWHRVERATAVRPHGVALDSQGRVWYTSADGAIHAIAGAGMEVSIRVGETPHAIAIDPQTDRAYVAVAGDGEVAAVDLRTQRVVARRWVGAVAESVAVSRDGGTVVVAAAEAESVSALNGDDLSLRFAAALPGRPVHVALTEESVLVSLAGRDAVAILDRRSGARQAVLDVGRLPDGIAVDGDERFAYVAAAGSNHIAVIDLEQRAVVGWLPADDGPSGVLWAASLPE